MVISKIVGGLGNQMFQYAMGRALSLKFGSNFLLDISAFDSYALHQGFELKRVFDVKSGFSQKADIENILGWQQIPFVGRLLRRERFSWARKKNFVIEPCFEYWEGVDSLPHDCYLSGYWQTERYFRKFSKAIRNDFSFATEMSEENTFFADIISRNNSVSIHVRRGDYVGNGIYAACAIEYYEKAMSAILEKVVSPVFFVFSDDIDWVKSNLRISAEHYYVSHNKGVESYNDMRLMSYCSHHVIANSSFSWWGAWLNPSPEKIVIAPKQWFTNGTNTKDLIPAEWTVL